MDQNLNDKILEILNSGKSREEMALQIEAQAEAMFSERASEMLREERTTGINVTCPMCMAEMYMFAEIGFSDAFIGACTCKDCKRSYSVHGNYSHKITRIIPDKEPPCTDSQQLRLSGT